MGRVKNAPTARKAGVKHGIKKPRILPIWRQIPILTEPNSTKVGCTAPVATRRSRRLRSRRFILSEVDLNENTNKKIKEHLIRFPKKSRIFITDYFKDEDIKEDTNTSLADRLSEFKKMRQKNIQEREAMFRDLKKEDTNTSLADRCLTDDGEDMSEYEKMRQKNIEEREAMFRDLLDTKQAVTSALTPRSQANRLGPSKRGLASVKREKEILPPRKSARLAGGKVAEIQRYVPELAPEEEHEGLPLETLDFKTVFKYDENEDKLKHAEEFLASYSKQITESKQKPTSSSQEYIERMKKWKITPELVAKVVPDRIFSVAIHPSEHKLLASAGGKWGKLGLWDIKDNESAENGVYLFEPHSRPINWQSWDRYNSKNLITTSYDGTSRILDIEKMESRLMYGDQKFLDEHRDSYTTMHQQVDANTFLVAKGKTGCLGFVDLRAGHESVVQNYHVFESISPKCISLHPLQTNLVCVANNKGGVFIFDLRQQGKGKSELLEPIAELMGHARSVSSATFNSTGDKVCTLSWDDKIRLFDTRTMKGDMQGKAEKRNNNTGRWLTPFKGLWHPVHEDVFFAGSMGHPRELVAWHMTSSMERVHSFRGDDFASISSVVAVHPTLDILIGGNSSGRLHAFM